MWDPHTAYLYLETGNHEPLLRHPQQTSEASGLTRAHRCNQLCMQQC